MANILDKDFKTNVLKILKELRRDVEKVKKMIYEQNRNINRGRKPKKRPKTFLELKSAIIIKNFTRGFQRQDLSR